MSKKELPIITIRLAQIVGGGQTIATMEDGRKLFVWGGLPGELVDVQLTKKKSKLAEGIVVAVHEPSEDRVEAKDAESYLSTSPWQIMSFAKEQHYKAALIEEAFELHDIVLPETIEVYSDDREYGYRNKMEFSWWWTKEIEQLDLAFFKRGTHTKIAVQSSSLATDVLNEAAVRMRDILRAREAKGFLLKTLLIRTSAAGEVAMQLYVKDPKFALFTDEEIKALDAYSFELIFSNPQSPASVITERLQQWGHEALSDTILEVPFRYATEGFFQINLPVYEQALRDMQTYIAADKPVVDLYSGVGTIGLTIGGDTPTLVEINEHAVREMKENIAELGKTGAEAVLSASEQALDHINGDSLIIVDPPRAGLEQSVVDRLLETKPERIVYLSCNPATQARDVARLAEVYGIKAHRGYNFFPRTPHIEHLVVLDKKA